MALTDTGKVAAPREGTAQFYIGTDCVRDSRFPLSGGDRFRATIVETVAGLNVVVLCQAGYRVNFDASQLALEAATSDPAGQLADDVDDAGDRDDRAETNGHRPQEEPQTHDRN